MRDYIKVVTIARNIITKQSISSLENTLPKDKFIRIHRSFIVVVNKIETFTNDIIEIPGHAIPISHLYKNEVEKLLKIRQ